CLSSSSALCFSTSFSFRFTASASSELDTLSLHDALPICTRYAGQAISHQLKAVGADNQLVYIGPFNNYDDVKRYETRILPLMPEDRKSTRLNSSHVKISYAVFCLKKKKE